MIWSGTIFQEGSFMVMSGDGTIAHGQCDPETLDVLEFKEFEDAD